VIDDWKKTDPGTRKAAEEKMQTDWKKWMSDHSNIFADVGAGVGKTKAVTPDGSLSTHVGYPAAPRASCWASREWPVARRARPYAVRALVRIVGRAAALSALIKILVLIDDRNIATLP